MNVIDQNLEQEKSGSIPEQDLNVNKLIAYLLFLFGYYFLLNANPRVQSNEPMDHQTVYLLECLALLVGGVLTLLPVASKILSIAGIGIILLITLLNFSTPFLGALPTTLLLHLAQGLVTFSLLTSLLQNTGYFKRPQQIIFITVFSIGLVRYLFITLMYRAHVDDITGTILVGSAVLIAGLIFIIIDNKPEPQKKPWADCKNEFPTLLKSFILPYVGLALLLYWCTMQTSTQFGLYSAFRNESKYFIANFTLHAAAIGILALIIFNSHKVNHWLLLYISGGMQLMLLLVALVTTPSGDNSNAWILASLSYLSDLLVGAAFTLWVYRHANFTYLPILLLLSNACADLAYFISIYVHIPFKYAFMNF